MKKNGARAQVLGAGHEVLKISRIDASLIWRMPVASAFRMDALAVSRLALQRGVAAVWVRAVRLLRTACLCRACRGGTLLNAASRVMPTMGCPIWLGKGRKEAESAAARRRVATGDQPALGRIGARLGKHMPER